MQLKPSSEVPRSRPPPPPPEEPEFVRLARQKKEGLTLLARAGQFFSMRNLLGDKEDETQDGPDKLVPPHSSLDDTDYNNPQPKPKKLSIFRIPTTILSSFYSPSTTVTTTTPPPPANLEVDLDGVGVPILPEPAEQYDDAGDQHSRQSIWGCWRSCWGNRNSWWK